MNRFSKLAIVGLLASCGVANYSAPRNLDNACAIAAERPAYMRAMKKAERRWGVPVHVQMAAI
ncbi:MAG: lytic transglycosylase, partial [Paracoccus sp. (in: a-proteobacteria)]